MTKIENRITQAAIRHNYSFSWRSLSGGYSLNGNWKQAVFECGSYEEMQAIESTFRQMRGIKVDRWCVFDGVFEGYVYVMDAFQSEEMERARDAERNRLEDWWMRYRLADSKTRALMACGAIK